MFNAALLGLAAMLTSIVLESLGVPIGPLIALNLAVWAWWIVRQDAVRKRIGRWNPTLLRRPDSPTGVRGSVVVSWASSNCTAVRVRNESTSPIDDVHLVVRQIKRLYQDQWIDSEEIPEGSLPARAPFLNAEQTRLPADSQTEFRFVHTVVSDAVTTGVRSRLNRQPLQLRRYGDWKVVVCAKWTRSGKADEREETLEFLWVKGAAPLAKPRIKS